MDVSERDQRLGGRQVLKEIIKKVYSVKGNI